MAAAERFIKLLARFMALLGGAVLILLVALTCVSVIGRIANGLGHSDFVSDNLPSLATFLTTLGPINGDFELVEAGIAFAILSFFPWCQISRSHAIVDLFTSALPGKANRILEFVWEVVLFGTMVVITWRMIIGASDKHRYGETTFLLQWPVWWGYAICALAAVVASLVAGYSVLLRWRSINNRTRTADIERGATP